MCIRDSSYIRQECLKLQAKGYEIYYPEMILCTDNAAMIASAGYYNFMAGKDVYKRQRQYNALCSNSKYVNNRTCSKNNSCKKEKKEQ